MVTTYNGSYVIGVGDLYEEERVRGKGIPTIGAKATHRLPQRYRVRWARGTRSFTDIDKDEVLRFATDLVAGDYTDPRERGKLYGKTARQAERLAAAISREDPFRAVAERYLQALQAE